MARGEPDQIRPVAAELPRAIRDAALSFDRSDTLLDHVPEIVFTADRDGVITLLSEEFFRITGIPVTQGLADGWHVAIHEPDRAGLIAHWALCVAERDSFSAVFRFNQRGGGTRWYRSRAVRRVDEVSGQVRWFGVCADFDDQKAAEMSLQRSEGALRISLVNQQRTERRARELQDGLAHQARLGVVGQYASALAHELNQPLTAAANYLAAVKHAARALEDRRGGKLAEVAERAGEQVLRAGQIVRSLRDFVSKGQAERAPEDLKTLLDEATDVALIGAHEAGVRVKLSLSQEPLFALVNKVQIQQVLVNLVRNAMDAMRGGTMRELEVALHAEDQGGTPVAITCVSDTGPGVTDTMVPQLFLPFVTDKHDGMGVGLSISRAIIRSHGGDIWHEPRTERGAVFKFSLPVLVDDA